MAIRILWVLYVLSVSAFLARSGQPPASRLGWLWLVVFCVWVLTSVGVLFRISWARAATLLCFLSFAGVLLFRSVARIAFVLPHGGMDCASCQGSPLVFLWQWQVELLLLLPGLFLAFWFWRSSRPAVAN